MRKIREEFDIGFFTASPYTVPDDEHPGRPRQIVWALRMEPSSLALTTPQQMIRLGSALLAQGLQWEQDVTDSDDADRLASLVAKISEWVTEDE